MFDKRDILFCFVLSDVNINEFQFVITYITLLSYGIVILLIITAWIILRIVRTQWCWNECGWSHRSLENAWRKSNTCQSNSDCPIYAFCGHNSEPTENGLCVCQDGYMIIAENKQRKCYKVASSINEECIFDEQCMHTLNTEAECWNNFCRCREGTHYVQRDRACYKSVKLGDFCRLTNNCIGENTVCRSGICVCPIDTHPSPDNLECINDIQLGSPCNSDHECININSRCHNVCRCKISHIISHDQSQCLRIADRLGGECEEDGQCLELISNSACDLNGKCVCADGFHELNQQCWTSVSHKGICDTHENCSITPGAICISGRCDCPDTLSYDKGESSYDKGECSYDKGECFVVDFN